MPKATQPPFEYLASASQTCLEGFEIARLNQVACVRNEIQKALEDWVAAEADARLARWFIDRHSLQSETPNPIEVSAPKPRVGSLRCATRSVAPQLPSRDPTLSDDNNRRGSSGRAERAKLAASKAIVSRPSPQVSFAFLPSDSSGAPFCAPQSPSAETPPSASARIRIRHSARNEVKGAPTPYSSPNEQFTPPGSMYLPFDTQKFAPIKIRPSAWLCEQGLIRTDFSSEQFERLSNSAHSLRESSALPSDLTPTSSFLSRSAFRTIDAISPRDPHSFYASSKFRLDSRHSETISTGSGPPPHRAPLFTALTLIIAAAQIVTTRIATAIASHVIAA